MALKATFLVGIAVVSLMPSKLVVISSHKREQHFQW